MACECGQGERSDALAAPLRTRRVDGRRRRDWRSRQRSRRPSGCAGSTNDGPGRGRAGQARGRRGVGLDRADVAGRHVDVGVIGVGTFAPNRRWSGRSISQRPAATGGRRNEARDIHFDTCHISRRGGKSQASTACASRVGHNADADMTRSSQPPEDERVPVRSSSEPRTPGVGLKCHACESGWLCEDLVHPLTSGSIRLVTNTKQRIPPKQPLYTGRFREDPVLFFAIHRCAGRPRAPLTIWI